MGSFKIWINGLWKDNIADKFDELKDAIPDIKTTLTDPLNTKLEGLKDAIPDIKTTLTDPLNTKLEGLKDAIPNIKTTLTDPLNTKLEELKNAIPDLKTEITKDITSKLNELKIDMPDLNGIFTDVLKKTIEDYKKNLPSADEMGKGFTLNLHSALHKGIIEAIDEITTKSKTVFFAPIMPLLDRDDIPQEIKDAIFGIEKHEGELGMAILDIAVGFYISNLLQTVSQPVFDIMSQEIYQKVGGKNPAILDAVNMKNRGIITEKQLNNIIQETGFIGEWTDHIKKGTKFHPAANDIIKFMVRDVFDETAVTKMKYDTDFILKTQDASKWIEGANIDLEVLKLYWRSHWELPSPLMLFEMLHRKVLTAKEVEDALMLADYAPASIPKMMEISYHPLTRVDVRRMHKLGVITSKEALVSAYEDGGYNRYNATLLADFTEQYNSTNKTEKERDLTKSEILNGYLYGEISKDEAITFLKVLGYDNEEADYIITIKDITQERKLETSLINVIKKEYSKGITTYKTAMSELSTLGLTQKRLGIITRQMNILKRNIEADK